MAVVTIRGQLGSGAQEIGKLLADRLHIDYVDREIIAEVAARLQWPERDIVKKERPPSGLLERIAEALERTGVHEGVYQPAWKVPLGDTHYLAGLHSVIRELAESQSIVIRGRGSQFILKDHPNAIHVLVMAPLTMRVERVMETLNLDEKAAKQEIERFDNSHREFTKRYFGAALEDPAHYDLVINTRRLSFEDGALVIAATLSSKDNTN